ncbi:MAG: TIGR01459 family HAD-type hydrolase [Rhodobacterales bacterium]|nr:MAG: TIGR01459 family HAD-type hydrolase [Rhodobacterales bacterium]
MTQIINALSEISSQYDALFVDLWGCVHDGVKPFPAAVAALQNYRKTGGKVVLITNAPRHSDNVKAQLARMNIPADSWDVIVSSGDSARASVFRGSVGQKVYYMGAGTDLSFFDPIDIVENPVDIQHVPLDQAEGIVCVGPFDPHADPQLMRPDFLLAKQNGLKMLCANPDIVVDRGGVREWCAGALAALYTEMGGQVIYTGKPHPAIYDLARLRLARLGTDIDSSRILCIGDGIATDIQGALSEDMDSLFISGGLAAAETKTTDQPDPDALNAYFDAHQTTARYAIGHLR